MSDIYIIPTQISREEYKKPLIYYLQNKNIQRACWAINNDPIVVTKTFRELNFGKFAIQGKQFHYKKCDLIRYLVCDSVYDTLSYRYDIFYFTFVLSNNIKYKGYLCLPTTCNKKQFSII